MWGLSERLGLNKRFHVPIEARWCYSPQSFPVSVSEGHFAVMLSIWPRIPDPSNGVVMGILQVAAQPAPERCCWMQRDGLVLATGSLGDQMLFSNPVHCTGCLPALPHWLGGGRVATCPALLAPTCPILRICHVTCPQCLE